MLILLIAMSRKVRRLFASFAPEHYDVYLKPDRDSLTLTGRVVIAGKKTGRPAQRLTLHQNGLKVESAKVFKADKKGEREIPVSRINHHKTLNEVRLHTKELLYPGRYRAELEFSGTISRNMDGIYPSFFKQDGQEKRLIATQFESHHAREAFPCIDEPEAKATFQLTLTSPEGEVALSNTPIEKESKVKGQDLKETTFEKTPVMSTYLLAFVFGELGFKEAKTKRGVKVRIYATKDNVAHTTFALGTAVKCLDFYEEYFGINYPLPKCDFIALPDFSAGAMENWGLITFREQSLLADPANTSLPAKQFVAMVIAHELTHQWFGNLVTMRWWTDLWLNEGFATWMSYLAVDHLFPEWQFWTAFATDEQQPALKLDALEHTHPIEVTVNHPDEIRTIFDAISYEKGASSIHMLARFLGKDKFREGLSYYLKRHAYGNTDTADLWDALEEISGKPVREFMSTWITQPGFPLVRALVNDQGTHLTQERFWINPKARERSAGQTDNVLWPIPVTTNGQPELFAEEEAHHEAAASLLINPDSSGFYRTLYNSSHLQRLGEAAASGRLSETERASLLADCVETAKAGLGSTADALNLLDFFANESSDTVWDIIAGSISSIRMVMDEPVREAMKPFTRNLIDKQLDRLGWDARKDESHFDTLLRPTILALASSADEHSVVAEAQLRFDAIKKDGSQIAPEIRGVIYVSAARHGDQRTFDRLLQIHNASTSSEERTKLAAALTDFRQPELIQRALSLVTTDDVRLQDAIFWVAYSFSNRHARQFTWDWMVKNWGWLKDNLGTDLAFYRLPLYAARAASNADFLPTYQKFFESVKTPGLERSINQGSELIEWQSAWKTRDQASIKAFLEARQ